MACSTCQVVVDEADFAKMTPPCEDELDMLDLAYSPQPTSRLGCQLVVTAELGGKVRVTIPKEAYNFYN